MKKRTEDTIEVRDFIANDRKSAIAHNKAAITEMLDLEPFLNLRCCASYVTLLTMIKRSTRQDLFGNEVRATFIIDEKNLEKIKAIAHYQRLTIKLVMNEAIENYLAIEEADVPNALESYRKRRKKNV